MKWSLLPLLAVSLAACGPAESPTLDPIDSSDPVVRTYREVTGQSLKAFVFSPAGRKASDAPAGAVLLFHGGGWSIGTPEWTFEAARRFADHGMVAISVEYRLSEGDSTPIEALDDVCAAFRWARGQALSLDIDPKQVAGYGVSAGGHLVTSAATVGCPQEDPTAVRSAPDLQLLWSPALDMVRDGWFEQKLQGRATAGAYSPLEHIRATTPPTSIVQGEEDTLTPLSGAKRFCARLVDLGGTCEVNAYPGVGHLLTRNLSYQEGDFDPDPTAVADGIEQHLRFLREQGFISSE